MDELQRSSVQVFMSLLAQGVTKNSSEYYFVALSVSLLAAQVYIRFIEEVLETYQLSTYMREIFYDNAQRGFTTLYDKI